MEKNACKFNRIVLNEKFIKNYNKDNNIGHILEIDVKYPKRLHNFHNNLPLPPERIKIEKCHKLVHNLYNKSNYVAHIKNLEQLLNHGLILKKCMTWTMYWYEY